MKAIISTKESERLGQLEAVIQHGQQSFLEVGAALMEIRDNHLYRSDYDCFGDYCREKWGWGKGYGNHIIRAAKAVGALPEEVATIVATEAHARALVQAKPDRRAAVALQAKAKAEAEGRRVTARDIVQAAKFSSRPAQATDVASADRPLVRSADEVLADSPAEGQAVTGGSVFTRRKNTKAENSHPPCQRASQLQGWYYQAKPEKRAEFCSHVVFQERVLVADRAKFRAAMERWFELGVNEMEPKPDSDGPATNDIAEQKPSDALPESGEARAGEQ